MSENDRYDIAQKHADVLVQLEKGGYISQEEQEALSHLLNASAQMSLDLIALTQTLERQAYSMSAMIAGHIWAGMYKHGSSLPVTTKVVDIAQEIVQEIYKR